MTPQERNDSISSTAAKGGANQQEFLLSPSRNRFLKNIPGFNKFASITTAIMLMANTTPSVASATVEQNWKNYAVPKHSRIVSDINGYSAIDHSQILALGRLTDFMDGGIGSGGSMPLGPDAAPPPAVVETQNIKSELISQSAIEARKAELATPRFVGTYEGGGEGEAKRAREESAGKYMTDLLATYGGYQGVREAVRDLNEKTSRPVNPKRNAPDNMYIVQDFGPDGDYGSILVGLMSPDWNIAGNVWPEIDRNTPISTVRGIGEIKNRNGATVPSLEIGVIVGLQNKEIDPNNLSTIAQSILYPSEYMKILIQKYHEKLVEKNGMSVDAAKELVLPDDSEFAVDVKGEAWLSTMQRIDTLMATYPDWNMSPAFAKFYNIYFENKQNPELKNILGRYKNTP